jgi:two-component system, NtrC family, response regulator AtoC
MPGRILVVDDDVAMCDSLGSGLPRRGYQVVTRNSAADAFALLESEDFDIVVTDIMMKGSSGLELCAKIAANRPDIPVVLITAFGTLETAVDAIRAGAYDFVTKPFDLKTLGVALDRAFQHRSLRQEVRRLRNEVAAANQTGDLLGATPMMANVRDIIARIAGSDAAVLIMGEKGTGKKVVARTLHQRSRRSDGPFVAVNCAALPEPLLESELFGHVRGAFAEANAPRPGLFAQAHGGTIFLDEVGELTPTLQAKLLRALQEKTIQPVGGDSPTPFDARIITATSRDLGSAVEDRRYREDLFFQINVVQIDLPPLRSRGNDILLLAQHFLSRHASKSGKSIKGLSPVVAEKLLAYAWPGNVRELENVMERAVAFARFEDITAEDLPEKIRSYQKGHVLVEPDDPLEMVPLEEIERRYILRVLEAVGGSRSQAAKILGVDRKTLYRKLGRYGAEAGGNSTDGAG